MLIKSYTPQQFIELKKFYGESTSNIKKHSVLAIKQEDYFGTCQKYLFNDPQELIKILQDFEKPGINDKQLIQLETLVLNKKEFNL